jgi:hypothetical protein
VALALPHRLRGREVGLAWQAFLRRFDIENTFRILMQTLSWTIPNFVRPRRPTAGPGSCWLLTSSCASPVISQWICAGPERKPDQSHDSAQHEAAGGFRTCAHNSGVGPVFRNLHGLAPDVPPGHPNNDPHPVTTSIPPPALTPRKMKHDTNIKSMNPRPRRVYPVIGVSGVVDQ